MIAKISGKIDDLKPTSVIIDVQGVGYELTISLNTYERIGNHENTELFVHTLHKEDQLKLFGFHESSEKSLFLILTSVQGIGPAMAMSIISGISPGALTEAVSSANSAALTRIPGIGKSKAEKLIFELKRKIKHLEDISLTGEIQRSPSSDAVEALASLGFSEQAARNTVDSVLKSNPSAEIEDIIKTSLKLLS